MSNLKQGELFENLPETKSDVIKFSALRQPVWTENKAKLVAKYLYYFVLITKHGAYIDGFAGPKNPDKPESWAAKLVLESKPKLLREFFLCDNDPLKLTALNELKSLNSTTKGRKIEVIEGDFNSSIDKILSSGKITPKKATFCLIDQFSTECHWETVKKIADFKHENKIEIFYFLASGWIDRALSGFKSDLQTPSRWWGNDNWKSLIGLKSIQRAQLFCMRFKDELNYKFAHAWPIYDKEGEGRRIMFHMIHATDHAEASKIMWRAYKNANVTPDQEEQLQIPLSEVESIVTAYKSK